MNKTNTMVSSGFKSRPVYFLLALSFLIASCEKKWKKPTDVSFGFQLNSNSGSGLIKFTSGYILLDRIDFDGERKQGSNNVDFSKDYDPNVQIDLSTINLSSGIAFDIPQGTYTRIDLNVRTEEQQNSMPNLVIYGTYINTINDTLAVQFEFNSGESFEITAQSSSGGNEIVLIEDQPSTTKIVFNPKYWFDVVPQSMLDSANITIVNGVQTIIVSENDNQDIYQLAADRIRDGNQVIIN
ncbi:MAG: hypothetical protein AB1458_05405 [Bacteroidota bacterium]